MNRIGGRHWHREEDLSEFELEQLQKKRLFRVVEQAYQNSDFYRRLYDEHGVKLGKLSSLSDLKQLPFTYPCNLQEEPRAFIASSDIVSIHCSGGTTKGPKTVFRTYSDYVDSCEVMARLFFMNGIRSWDTVAILQPFGIWAIGALAFEGLKRISARALPLGIHMSDDTVIQLLREHNASAMFVAPSNCLRLAEYLRGKGFNPSEDFDVERVILAGEKVTSRHRKTIQEKWGAESFSLYGSEETDGLATECVQHAGLHFCADHFLLEVIDPITEAEVEPGELGEAVITTLTKSGSPLIRYRIGDLVRVLNKECDCGRKLPLVDIKGRASEVLVLTEGTKVYPYQVDAALDELEVEVSNYQVVRDKDPQGKDVLLFNLEIGTSSRGGDLAEQTLHALEGLSVDFADAYSAGLVQLELGIQDPGTIQPTPRGKIRRFIDKAQN